MKGKKLLDAFDGIDASMLLEAEPTEKEVTVMKRMRKIRKPLILVAAILLTVAAMSVSVVAGRTHSDMEPYWNQAFVPREETEGKKPLIDMVTKEASTEPLREEIVSRLDEISSIPEDVAFTGDNDDVMFNVVGVTGAGNAAYIWLEVVLSDELLAQYHGDPGYIMLGRTRHEIPNHGTTGGTSILFLGSKASLLGSSRLTAAERYPTEWSGSAGEDGGEQAALESRPDNTFCFIYRFQLSYVSSLSGKELTITIQNLTRRDSYESEEPSTPLAEGPWQLKFTMNFTETALLYHPKVAGERYVCDMSDPSRVSMTRRDLGSGVITEVELAYSTLKISPIYMQIDMGCRTPSSRYVARPKYCMVVMADGTQFEVATSGGGSSGGSGEYSDLYVKFFFEEPIDHTQVVEVIYAGVTFSLTEDVLQK